MQKKYSGRPVRFFLTPCNQFAGQEPNSNAAIKMFAAKYLDLDPPSSVVMLSKSTVNAPRCVSHQASCTLDSKSCCASNNAVYAYLEAVVKSDCNWNFNKYPIGKTGLPNGKRYDDDVYAEVLEKDIDALLNE